MTNSTNAKPRYDLEQAAISALVALDALQLHHAALFLKIEDNAYSRSLKMQWDKYGALTARQWELAYECWSDDNKAAAMHKRAKASRMYRGKNSDAQKQTSDPDLIAKAIKQDNDNQTDTNTMSNDVTSVKPRHLSAKQTRAIQEVIKSHPRLDEFKAAFNVQRLRLQGKQLFDACAFLQLSIDDILADRRDKAQQAFDAINTVKDVSHGSIDWERVRAIARDEVERRAKPVTITKMVLDQGKTKQPVKIDGIKHPQFDTLFTVLNTVAFNGDYLNVILCGPTGTGKSFAARQIAKVLGLTFFLQVQALENYDLIGYEKINGEMKETPFLIAFREGGVVLLDELDSYDPKAVTALNSALANGELLAPDGSIIKRHKEFRCIGATNTNGLGATHDYTSREQLDLATLSRFTVELDWYTNKEMELLLAEKHGGDMGKAWAIECDKARQAMAQLDLPALVDQRTIEAGIGLLQNNMEIGIVRDITYLARLNADQKIAVKNIVGV